MQASRALREKMAQLLAADTATLAPAALAINIALVKAAFSPSEGLAFADVTLADFDGSDPIDITVGAQAEGLDPVSSDAIITLSPPIGGFRWETTGATNLPQTIYGCVLLNNAGDTILASLRLPTPIVLTAVNQVLDLGNLYLRQIANSLV